MQYEDPFALFEARRAKRDQERLSLRKRLAELEIEATEDTTAVTVLRKVYAKETQASAEASMAQQFATAVREAQAKEVPTKELILAVLREATPAGMTAKQIKEKALLKYRRHINPNTLTVSLVRASKPHGLQPASVRCDGRTWYYLSQPPEVPNVGIRRAPELALNGGHK